MKRGTIEDFFFWKLIILICKIYYFEIFVLSINDIILIFFDDMNKSLCNLHDTRAIRQDMKLRVGEPGILYLEDSVHGWGWLVVGRWLLSEQETTDALTEPLTGLYTKAETVSPLCRGEGLLPHHPLLGRLSRIHLTTVESSRSRRLPGVPGYLLYLH